MADDVTLDLAALERLREWGGEELSTKMVQLFTENAPGRVAAVRQGLAEGDLELAHRSAHSLKSSAANVGAEALRALAGEIEARAGTGRPEEAAALLDDLERRLEEALHALRDARTIDTD